MALLARLFSPRKSNKKDKFVGSSSFNDNKSCAFNIDKNDVRVLLFRECDWRGRKLLFDSTSVEKVPLDPKNPRPRSNTTDMIVEVAKGFGYKYKRPHADTNNLGETIFGSIAMLTRGSSIKIHTMKDPPRIMFTKIIQAPRSAARSHQIQSDEKILDDSQGSSVNSIGECFNSGSFGSKSGSFEGVLEDSGVGSGPNGDWLGCNSSQHCSCPVHPPSLAHLDDNNQTNSSSSLHSTSSLSSLRRRWARSVATTLNFSDPVTSQPATAHQPGKRTKLGIAVIVPLANSDTKGMEQFFLERMPQLNNILTRLQHSTERAYCRRDMFVQSMLQASCCASQSVCELVSRARLEPPLWLTLTTAPTPDTPAPVPTADLAAKLVADLIYLLNTLDTKHTNFFISTLLTAVLTHHLGWVPTVFHEMPSHTMLADLSKNHPYNPLWAQLSDLQGALGYPPKIAKTVVVGKSEILVQKLLSVLSYFIRCGHVKSSDLERDIPLDEENYLDRFISNEQEKTAFDKDAIREFSKAGSFEGNAFSSTTTLTKSKTVLSMKTFCITESKLDNANSLESGFESCNDCSGESFEDTSKTGKPLTKIGKSKSSAHLLETSFSDNTIKTLIIPNENNIKLLPSYSLSHFPIMKIVENDQKDVFKIENEKQFTSCDVLDPIKKTSSKSSLNSNTLKNNFFTKENLMPTDCSLEDNEKNKVVFLLGENEELRNLKSQDEANIPDTFKKKLSNGVKTPIILIDDIYATDNLLYKERCETENKAGFVAGDINSRVVIVRSTPVKLDDTMNSKLLKTNQLHRCLSVPEEAVSETAWVKRRRSKEAAELIRRWLSDSALETVPHKPFSDSFSENTVNCATSMTLTPASVFRTSNRTLKDTSVDMCENESVELALSSKVSFEVPTVEVEEVDMQASLLKDEYTELPFQSSVEETQPRGELGVAASLFAGLGDSYKPEWLLQGVSELGNGWLAAMRHSLALEAYSTDCTGGDSELAEAVCVVANTDTWEVVVVSNHSPLGEGASACVGMSQLVANMLETVNHLNSLSVPPHQCLSHLETKLSELCLRSQALSELLLASDFLDIATLTSALDLDANDVPLLLSIASTHTPLVTRKYGLSFQ